MGTEKSHPPITCDCSPPIGDGEGYMGLELLLMSLAACGSTSIVCLLRKMKKGVNGFNVHVKGISREQQPCL